MRRLFRAVFLTCALVAASVGDSRGASYEPRIALVVGNSAYRNAPPLKNPVNDARDMAKALRELGFEVIEVQNASKQQLERAIGQFSGKLTEGSVGPFYFSGHGIQTNGHNFLIPVDAELASEAAVRIETTDVDLVLELMTMAQTRVNLVILDACRSNPFERRFRALGRGLAPVEQAPRGTLVAYSTAPGKVASDGDGANGLYTAELLKAIRIPGLKAEEVFKTVRIAVSAASNDNQTPWEASSLTGNFLFRPSAPVIATPPPPVLLAPSVSPDAADIAFWNSIKDETEPAVFEAYLRQFPSGRFTELARYKIASQSKPRANQTPQVAVVTPPPPAASASTGKPPRAPPQTAVLPPPAASASTNASGEFAFHCPRPGTVVRYDTGASLTFTGGNGPRCAYTDGTGRSAEKFAAFADDARLLDAGLDKLWPLKVGNEQKFTISASGSFPRERYTVLRRENITVPAGSFDTFVVEWEENGRTMGYSNSYFGSKRLFWCEPALGLIVKSIAIVDGSVAPGTPSIGGDYQAVSIDGAVAK
jgi:uncharacterized caspase-like protein